MTTSPIKLCAFDIETRGRNPEFISGAIVSDITTGYYTNATEMIDVLRMHARKRYTLVAHNAEYDVSVLFWKNGEDVRIDYTNGIYTSAYWRHGVSTRHCPIWDSYRLAAGLSLDSLGQSIGIKKYPTPKRLLDPDDVRQDWMCETHQTPGCIECYNLRDTEIVWGYMNMLREWLSGYGLSLKKSLPSIAMELWELWDVGSQQTMHSKTLRQISRAGYHGGRCEPFVYGEVLVPRTYDIRSYYGSLLLSARLPHIGELRYVESPTDIGWLETAYGVAEATVRIDSQHCPPIPVVANDRIYYPVGDCHGVWPLSELRASLVHGVKIIAIHKAAYAETTVFPFSRTAAGLLELRETWRRQGDPREIIAKFVINAVIGRLGLRDVSERVSYRRWQKGMTKEDMNGSDIESSDGAVYLARRFDLDRVARLSNPLWAACITGYGRQALYQHLINAGTTLMYCDTDSVHCSRMLDTGSDAPGNLVSTGEYDKGLYLGPKLYRLEAYDGTREVRAKGIPRKNAANFLANGYTQYQTTLGVVESIAKGIAPSTWIDVERIGHYSPGTRTILDPSAIGHPDRQSKTAPCVFAWNGTENMELG